MVLQKRGDRLNWEEGCDLDTKLCDLVSLVEFRFQPIPTHGKKNSVHFISFFVSFSKTTIVCDNPVKFENEMFTVSAVCTSCANVPLNCTS